MSVTPGMVPGVEPPLGTLIAVAPTGRHALLQAGEVLRVADLTLGEVQSFEAPDALLWRECWLPDGEQFALTLANQTPAVVKARTGTYIPLAAASFGSPPEMLVSAPSVARRFARLVLQRTEALEVWQVVGGEPRSWPLGKALALPTTATPIIDPTGQHVAFREQGRVVVVALDSGQRRAWTEYLPQQQFDLVWAPTGQRFLCAGTLVDLAVGQASLLLRPAPDTSDAPLIESIDWLGSDDLLVLRSRTILRDGLLVREQQVLQLQRRDGVVVRWQHREPADPIRPTGFSALRVLPGQAACLLTHHTIPQLFRLELGRGEPMLVRLTLREPQPLRLDEDLIGPRAFSVAPSALVVQRRRELPNFTPYLHQLRDVPDWFHGDWACGPATCVMLAAHFGRLPRWPLPVGNGSRATDYGAYVAGLWEGGGQRFAVQQKDPNGNLARGAYGYICPPGTSFVAADWGRMEQFLRLMGLQVQANLANVSGLDWERVWARLVEQIDQNHACLLSVTLKHTDGRTIEHILLAYGYVEYTNGQRALIAKDPYGNWTGAGFGGQGGDGVHYWLNRSGQGAPASGLIRIKFIRGVWNDQPQPAGVVLDDVGRDFLRFGPADRWHFESNHGYGSPGRPLMPGPSAMGLWWAPTMAFGPWQSWAVWRFQVAQAGRYCLFAFVPSNQATTANARYFVAQSSNGIAPAPALDHEESALVQVGSVAQNQYHDEWRLVGELGLQPGWVHFYLSTMTGESGKRIAFDALRLDGL